MITIDLVHEYREKTEKPHLPTTSWLAPASRPPDAIYQLATERHQVLLRAAREARLATKVERAGKAGPVEGQRNATQKVTTVARVKRYTSRLIALVSRNLVKGER